MALLKMFAFGLRLLCSLWVVIRSGLCVDVERTRKCTRTVGCYLLGERFFSMGETVDGCEFFRLNFSDDIHIYGIWHTYGIWLICVCIRMYAYMNMHTPFACPRRPPLKMIRRFAGCMEIPYVIHAHIY